MKLKTLFILLLSFSTLSYSFKTHLYSSVNNQTEQKGLRFSDKKDDLVKTLASLTFFLKVKIDDLSEVHTKEAEDNQLSDPIAFTEEEIQALWNRAALLFSHNQTHEKEFFLAHTNFQNFQDALNINHLNQARLELEQCLETMSALWEAEIEHLSPSSTNQITLIGLEGIRSHKTENNSFENNPYIPSKAKKEMRPYLLSQKHPLKKILDKIFRERVTLNEETFYGADFHDKGYQPRSFVHVASHPSIQNYLLKLFLDNDLRQKQERPSWWWLVQRCKGAEKIRYVIKDHKFKHFTVPHKSIYPLPAEPSPPNDGNFTRHLAVLVVDDMHLVSEKLNIQAWYETITKSHLDELYTIISWAKGSSYRPDNIWYTIHNQFAFIDTEYPDKTPDFQRIRRYLRPEMLKYWDELIKKGQ